MHQAVGGGEGLALGPPREAIGGAFGARVTVVVCVQSAARAQQEVVLTKEDVVKPRTELGQRRRPQAQRQCGVQRQINLCGGGIRG